MWYGTAELERQLDLNRATDGIDGEIHFRYRLMQEDDKIPAFLADYYGEEDDNNTPPDPGVNPPDDTDSPDEEQPGDQPGNSDNPGNDERRNRMEPLRMFPLPTGFMKLWNMLRRTD